MNLKNLCLIVLFISSISFSQTITVDDASYSATDLANLLLNGSCIDPTNISYSSGQSVAYFNQNASSFPITEGIIIRTGEAILTEGLYTDTNLNSQVNNNGDVDLEAISTSTGQNATITDTAFLQFDFIPISSDFNFNFVFASNEYGQWQCGFSDVFAFLLTDLTTNITTNLAIVPGTAIPITVATVRDNANNNGCTSENAGLFSVYNVTNPAASSLNMRGHTTVLNASSVFIPNNPYQIRLVIGDYNNPDYDSAVFIDSGSFTTPLDIGNDTSLCAGNTINLTTGLNQFDYNHTWTFDGNPIATTNNNIDVTLPGTYVVTAVKGGCILTDTIIISDLAINAPDELFNCDDGSTSYSYDLTVNSESQLGLDSLIYDVVYFSSQANIPNTPITAPDITNYMSPGGEIIYVKIFNILTNTYCDVELSFDLSLSSSFVANPPVDIQLCNTSDPVDATLTDQDIEILNGLNPVIYTVNYFNSQADAMANTNPIGVTLGVSIANSPLTVWANVQDVNNPNCIAVTSFEIIVNPLPPVSIVDDVIECSEYILPVITDGVYYDGPGGPTGTGNVLNAGDIIVDAGTYYIYNGPDANGCFNESSFVVTLIDVYTIREDYCDEFIVPTPPLGAYYTELDGPNGTGCLLPVGTTFNDTATSFCGNTYSNTFDIYYYAEINGVVCRNEPFAIVIHVLPLVDTLLDITECIQTTLPALINGAYYSDSAGTTPLPSTTLTTSQTVYIYNEETYNLGLTSELTCSNFTSFEVNIINITTDVTECGSYTLPVLTIGNYFTAAAGGGTQIAAGTIIDTIGDTNIFIFSPTSTAPNCTDNLMFTVTIIAIPNVSSLTNALHCIDDPFIFTAIPDGDFFSGPGRTGTQYNVGDQITTIGTQTIYINNLVNGCSNETNFDVEIRDLPLIDNFTDVYVCVPYDLQSLTNGVYYDAPDGPNGGGAILASGTTISVTQVIYIYNEWADLLGCSNETIFTVNMLGVGTFADINACDNHTLTPPPVGDYYTAPGVLPANLITNLNYVYDPLGTNTYTIYVGNEDRFICETSFELTLTETPVLPVFNDVDACRTYDLAALDTTTYNAAYYTASGGNVVDEIDVANYNLTAIGTQTIYVFASAFNDANCNVETSFEVNIVDIVLDEYTSVIECDSYLLPQLDNSFANINYYSAPGGNAVDLITGTDLLINTSGIHTIYVNAHLNSPVFCPDEKSFTVTIGETPILSSISDIDQCVTFDLPILDNSNYNIEYYSAPGGNATDLITVANYTLTTIGTQTIYVYATSFNNVNCFDEIAFDVTLYPPLVLDLDGGIICIDPITGLTLRPILLESNLNNGFEVNWYLNGNLVHTGQNFLADAAGDYTVETIQLFPEVPPNCNYAPTTVSVIASSAPYAATITVSEDFANVGVITVDVTSGIGVYQYQLDNGPFQDSNVFYDVSSGDHTVTIIDVFGGCGPPLVEDVIVINYPKFFTPNNDGHNDYWNIWDLSDQPLSTIHIFDRFGKFIKQIYPSSGGWDGLYNGFALPATDYWFLVTYIGRNGEEKEFRAHFSLKR